jgi:hypothetical protein
VERLCRAAVRRERKGDRRIDSPWFRIVASPRHCLLPARPPLIPEVQTSLAYPKWLFNRVLDMRASRRQRTPISRPVVGVAGWPVPDDGLGLMIDSFESIAVVNYRYGHGDPLADERSASPGQRGG